MLLIVLMKTFTQFMTSCLIMSSGTPESLKEYYYGDSIAVGYGGNSPGRRRVGASPNEVLRYLEQDLKDNPNRFKGQTINLSTGVSNNPDDFDSIERQLKLLRSSDAIVNVLGAAIGRYDSQNERLRSLTSQYGANFKGGFTPGKDGVHPASYSTYDTGSTPRVVRPSTSTPQSTQSSSSSSSSPRKVLSKLRGVEGEGVGSSFVARKWNSSEKERYNKYGGK
jgi:hypothetical protein